jgi:hypothetical protein
LARATSFSNSSGVPSPLRHFIICTKPILFDLMFGGGV